MLFNFNDSIFNYLIFPLNFYSNVSNPSTPLFVSIIVGVETEVKFGCNKEVEDISSFFLCYILYIQ